MILQKIERYPLSSYPLFDFLSAGSIAPFMIPPFTSKTIKQESAYSKIPNFSILVLKSSLNFTNLPMLFSSSTERSRGVLTKAGHTALMRTP